MKNAPEPERLVARKLLSASTRGNPNWCQNPVFPLLGYRLYIVVQLMQSRALFLMERCSPFHQPEIACAFCWVQRLETLFASKA